MGVAAIYASYAVVYHREGKPDYRQWKWITFFTPMFVAAICASLFLLASLLPSPARMVTSAYTTLGAYALIATLFSTGTAYSLRSPSDYLAVTLDEIDLHFDGQLRQLPSLHLDTSPYWETMWLAYFLRDTPVTLGPVSYYPPSAATGPWVLQRNDQPVAAGATAIVLNTTYRLVMST